MTLNIAHAFTRVDYRIEVLDSPLEQKKALLQGLEAIASDEKPALTELRDWLKSVIDDEQGKALIIPTRPRREVVEVKQEGAIVYQFEKVRCGKANCKSCPHGAYWYGYQREGSKIVSWYIGKEFKAGRRASGGTKRRNQKSDKPK